MEIEPLHESGAETAPCHVGVSMQAVLTQFCPELVKRRRSSIWFRLWHSIPVCNPVSHRMRTCANNIVLTKNEGNRALPLEIALSASFSSQYPTKLLHRMDTSANPSLAQRHDVPSSHEKINDSRDQGMVDIETPNER